MNENNRNRNHSTNYQNSERRSDSRNRRPRYDNNSRRGGGGLGRFFFATGQLFGLVYNLAVLYIVYDFAMRGHEDFAVKIFAINAGIMAFAIIISFFERLSSARRRQNRDNRNYSRNQ